MKSNGKESESLVKRVEFVKANGEVVVKYITYYTDLLAAAHEVGIKNIITEAVQLPNAGNGQMAVIKAIIETGQGSFCALGDASPDNVEQEFLPHLIRVAETRAKARALRDALNVGVAAYEEIAGRMAEEERGHADKGRDDNYRSQPGQQNGNSSDDGWSEKQRRLIFRLLLKKRGIEGDMAREHLFRVFNVNDLRDVNRKAASQYIDRLINENGADTGSEASHA